MFADGALNLSIFVPGEMTFAGVQSLVVVFSTLQTGGSPSVQHDLEHVVLVQLWTTPLMVLVVLVGVPHVSAPHCFGSACATMGAKKTIRSKNLMLAIASSLAKQGSSNLSGKRGPT
jgi:hypothetical protein